MIQELTKDLIENYYSVKINKNTRKADYVEARAMYYKLMRSHTNLSLDRIGRSVGRDHAGVINALKRLDGWLSYDKRIINIYYELNKKIVEEKLKSEGIDLYKNVEDLYGYKYIKLAEKYNELLIKFEFIKCKLGRFHPHVLESEEFKVGDKIDANVQKEEA
tara:strand:- start:4332 stop:4817 length:486 start_codon:yes stop_codon:yes gene_type:complete